MSTLSYEFTGLEKVNSFGVTVKQIRAIRDIPGTSVRKDDVGGWIESAELPNGNARLSGNAWVSGDARVSGNARLSDNARVSGDARVSGNAWVSGNARVSGNAQVVGNAWVYGNAQVFGDATVSGDARIFDNATVSGNAQVYGNAWVYGDAQVYSNAQVFGNARVFSNARVSGDAMVSRDAKVYGNARVKQTSHYLVVGPIGSESVTATLFRTKNGGHALVVGCWTGTLGELSAEVKRRRLDWDAEDSVQEVWVAQYKALKALGKATITQWKETK